MTDKQIIIDGVDVSGCYCYVSTSKEYSCGLTCSKFHYRFCKENPNCYYKQLKRLENEYEGFAVKYTDMEIALHNKEQECEELKIYIESNEQQVKEVEMLVMDNDRLINELDQLKASLDEKNKFLEQLGISATGEFKRIKYYVDKLVKENEELKSRRCAWKSLEGTLCPEAQEQLSKLKKNLAEIKEIVSSTLDCGEWVGQGDNKMEQILNKISEVTND